MAAPMSTLKPIKVAVMAASDGERDPGIRDIIWSFPIMRAACSRDVWPTYRMLCYVKAAPRAVTGEFRILFPMDNPRNSAIEMIGHDPAAHSLQTSAIVECGMDRVEGWGHVVENFD